jgi:hypothetical protein
MIDVTIYHSPSCSQDRVRRMLRELENAEYLTRARSKKPYVRWAWQVELSDTPAPLLQNFL